MNRCVLAALVAVPALALLAGCTSGDPSGSEVHTLRMEGPATMVDNYNPFGPSEKGPGLPYIYDALVRTDYQHPEDPIKPWLAESWSFSEDGKILTLTLRDDVSFSDGEPLTSKDVAFTLNVPLDNPELNPWGAAYTAVEAPDDQTIVLTFTDIAYGQLAKLANAPIVQEAQWEGEDVATFTNPEPIGSGLLALDEIRAKSAFFDVRDDYWQGESAVDRVEMVSFSPETYKLQLANGDLEWSGAAWPTAENEFVNTDDENHHAYVVPHGGAESLVLASDKAPFDDVHARRAIALAIDVASLAAINALPVPSPCGLTASRYADDVLIDHCQGGATRKVDIDAAEKELAAGGWNVEGGNLVKGDQSIQVTFAYPVSWTSAEPLYRDIKAQLQENLGLDVRLLTPPGDQYDTAVAEAHGALRFTAGAAGMLDAYRWLGTPGNFGGWDDPRTTELVATMSATVPGTDEYVELGKELQQIVYDDVPLIPTVGGNWSILINSSNWSGWPEDPNAADYVATPYAAPDATMIMLGLQPK